jgi:hypothetical protein
MMAYLRVTPNNALHRTAACDRGAGERETLGAHSKARTTWNTIAGASWPRLLPR